MRISFHFWKQSVVLFVEVVRGGRKRLTLDIATENPPVHLEISEYPECSISSLACSSWWKDLFLKLVNYPSCLDKTILEYWGHYQNSMNSFIICFVFLFICFARGFWTLFLWSGRPWTPCSFWAFSCYVLEVWKSDLPLFCWYGMVTYFFLLLRSCWVRNWCGMRWSVKYTLTYPNSVWWELNTPYICLIISHLAYWIVLLCCYRV